MKNISEIYANHIDKILSERIYKHPYFVTTSLCKSYIKDFYSFRDVTRYAWYRYDHYYRHLTSRLMRNFSKKPTLHPLTFDFIDMPNTRRSQRLNLHAPSIPHIHSVYLVHEATIERFEALRREAFHSIVHHPSLHAVQAIDAQPIEQGALPQVVSYAAKLLNNHEAIRLAGDCPLFTQYPKARFERISRRFDWDVVALNQRT
jgi:hypothetical protein